MGTALSTALLEPSASLMYHGRAFCQERGDSVRFVPTEMSRTCWRPIVVNVTLLTPDRNAKVRIVSLFVADCEMEVEV